MWLEKTIKFFGLFSNVINIALANAINFINPIDLIIESGFASLIIDEITWWNIRRTENCNHLIFKHSNIFLSRIKLIITMMVIIIKFKFRTNDPEIRESGTKYTSIVNNLMFKFL